MKLVKFLIVGFIMGIVMSKSEIISWYRINEMFHFQSFHMYGVIGSAVMVGALGVFGIRKFGLKDIYGAQINLNDKSKNKYRYILGGIIFGLGWAMTGACPGPLFVLFGHGFIAIGIVIISAVFGTFLYGLFREKLPH